MLNQETKKNFMQIALEEAKKAADLGEVPVGAILLDQDDQIVATAHNRIEGEQFVCSHAEIRVIEKASKKLNNWRLNNYKLFVTLEPCPMCASAIVLSRISEVYFGCHDPRMGAAGSLMNLCSNELLPHQAKIEGNILQEECSTLLKDFFKKIRLEKR